MCPVITGKEAFGRVHHTQSKRENIVMGPTVTGKQAAGKVRHISRLPINTSRKTALPLQAL